MLKKMSVCIFFLFFNCIFSTSYSHGQEAEIKLDSPEQIAQFQKLLEDDDSAKNPENQALPEDLSAALSEDSLSEKTDELETEFKVYKPQAKDDESGQVNENGKNIKRLDSDEDLAEFEELLKKAQFN